MKKYLSFLAITSMILLAGCSSSPSADSSTALAETEIAWITKEAEPQDTTTPPQLMVEFSGDGLASASALTLGNYDWNGGSATGASPLTASLDGKITTQVDLDLVAEGEPKLLLNSGAELTSVEYYPLDGTEGIQPEFTADGVIKLPQEATYGIVTANLTYPQGSAEYYFLIKRSQTDQSQPPELRIYSGDIGFAMTRNGYEWTVTEGEEAHTAVVDCPSPWQAYSSGLKLTSLHVLPSEELTVMLPDNSSIISAGYYTAEDEAHDLAYSGNKLTMPSGDLFAVCNVTVQMPQGSCSYIFTVQAGEEASSPAYEPSLPPELTAEYNGEQYELRKFSYKWIGADGIEHSTAAGDMPGAWEVRDELAQIHAEPGSSITLDLPDGAEIFDTAYQTSHDESWTMEFSGNTLTAPEELTESVCTVRIKTAQGWCDYSFVVNTLE